MSKNTGNSGKNSRGYELLSFIITGLFLWIGIFCAPAAYGQKDGKVNFVNITTDAAQAEQKRRSINVRDGESRSQQSPSTAEEVASVNRLTPGVANAVRNLAGCTTNTLPANDDGSSSAVTLPFSLNFFGANFSQTYVNNNGNITFTGTLGTYTPFGLIGTDTPIIAPFFADVDTRGTGSGLTQYGNTTVDGRQAFCVNYINVGYYSSNTDRLNSFQLILINRSDTGAGNFDIEFNYNQIQWETGDASGGTGGIGGTPARAGYANGSNQPGASFEIQGSGATLALLDSNNATGLTNNSLNSGERGRYIFFVRGGGVSTAPRRFDFDGDGKSDFSVFRPSNGVWYVNRSTAGFYGAAFGLGTDRLAPADYDGDGRTDIAVYRSGVWYILQSTAGFKGVSFGSAEDLPRPGDFDGDGKADIALFRPSTGAWYYLRSLDGGFRGVTFGQAGDVPLIADYDGDGKSDVAVFRQGFWYYLRSVDGGFRGSQFGAATDIPVVSDFDGDNRADLAVFRPNGGFWYWIKSSDNLVAGAAFGQAGDVPAAADYDGDGKADLAVFRGGNWYSRRSSNNAFTGITFGAASDLPVPAAYLP